MNIDLNGNISDWENDPVYNSMIELMNWGQGCANVDACNYDQISNYDNEACWFKNDDCECSDDLGCGCFEPGPSGCDNVCGSTLENDACGVCNGDNSTCTGCSYQSACNYDANVTIDDGSCVFAEQFYDCDGNCITEIDCAGECNGLAELDECGVCGGDGSADGFDCDGNQLYLFNGLIPENFSIHSIYPNPFNPITSMTYGLPEHVNVQIIVYDLSGKEVETLMNGFQTPGYHSVNWNADNLPSGVYLIRLESGEFIQTQKVVLIK